MIYENSAYNGHVIKKENTKMKNVKKVFGIAMIGAFMAAGCAGQAPAAPVDFEDGQAVVEEFEKNGFAVNDVKANGEDEVAFKVAGPKGGANVMVQTFDNVQDALNAYDTTKASMTQSMYYMMTEQENGRGSVAVFNNSINYVDAVVALDAKTNTVLVVREVAQDNMEDVYNVLATYGFEF